VPGERSARRKSKGLPRRITVALASLLASLALIATLSRPAGRYFYCEAMGMLPWDPCAAAAAEDDDAAADDATSTIREHHADCCDVITIPSTPRAAAANAPTVPPPALVAALPALVFPRVRVVAPPPTRTSTFERWRVPLRPPGQARAQLMVFLT